jgi:hypothetical protein
MYLGDNADQDPKGQDDIHQEKEAVFQRLVGVNARNYSPKKWLMERTMGIRPISLKKRKGKK